MPRRKTREQRHQNRFSVNNTHRGAGVQQQNGVAAEVLSRRQLGERVMRGRSKLQVLMLAVAAAAFAFAFAFTFTFTFTFASTLVSKTHRLAFDTPFDAVDLIGLFIKVRRLEKLFNASSERANES